MGYPMFQQTSEVTVLGKEKTFVRNSTSFSSRLEEFSSQYQFYPAALIKTPVAYWSIRYEDLPWGQKNYKLNKQ